MNILFTTSAAPEKSPFFTNEKRTTVGIGLSYVYNNNIESY